jgi:dihydrofolate reductase
MQNISLIVAMANNHVIGINNGLPWHLPEDLKHFRALTTGHHMIMGRKTYDSLGRLLPGRTTVIVTRNIDFKVEGALIAHSLQEAVQLCKNDTEVFIIGGAELYKDGLAEANQLYVTEVNLDVDGDAFFPMIDLDLWTETAREPLVSEKGISFSYVLYKRK